VVTSDKALYDGLLRDVQRAAMRLAEAATLGRADIERAVHAIDVPPASEPLLELVIGTPRIDAMSVLLSSLVLRRPVRGTPHQDPWLAIFARTAETVIFELRLLGLFDLRLELLDEIITQPPQGMSLAALHFERANTRRVLAGKDGDAMRVVWEDLQIAIAQAQQEGNVDIYAGSIAFQAKLLAGSAEDIPDRVAAGAALAEQIREMLATLPALDPFRRMQLLQARAALTLPAVVELLRGHPRGDHNRLRPGLATFLAERPSPARVGSYGCAATIRGGRCITAPADPGRLPSPSRRHVEIALARQPTSNQSGESTHQPTSTYSPQNDDPTDKEGVAWTSLGDPSVGFVPGIRPFTLSTNTSMLRRA
jgi:hypothetical protein